MIKRIALPDGSRVGISGLDSIINEVAAMELADAGTIKAELLKRVKAHNYVAPSAKDEYSVALFREYQVKLGISKPAMEKHKHTAG
jgi:hypothetical protein